jgi:hypothetical protein
LFHQGDDFVNLGDVGVVLEGAKVVKDCFRHLQSGRRKEAQLPKARREAYTWARAQSRQRLGLLNEEGFLVRKVRDYWSLLRPSNMRGHMACLNACAEDCVGNLIDSMLSLPMRSPVSNCYGGYFKACNGELFAYGKDASNDFGGLQGSVLPKTTEYNG